METYASICSGAGCEGIAFERLGWRCTFHAETAKYPSQVLRYHYPDTPNLGDFTAWPFNRRQRRFYKETGREPLDAIDLLIGGTPCQAFSVAGARRGLDDARGNLTIDFLRMVRRYKPRFVIWENVPGVISLDGGDTLRQILDTFEEIGYIVDIDILNTEFFGVPQRRRRVFICGEHTESIRKRKTTLSAQTLMQCLIEIWHGILVEARGPSGTGRNGSASESKLSSDGLKKRMRLFSLHEDAAWEMWLANLGAEVARSARGHASSVSGHGDFTAMATPTSRAITGARSSHTSGETGTVSASTNIAGQWRTTLDEALKVARSFITSTATRTIAESEIFTCSQAVLSIARLTVQSTASCPTFWALGSSTLTALRAFTNYARQTGNDLFTDPHRVRSWRDFQRQATHRSFRVSW